MGKTAHKTATKIVGRPFTRGHDPRRGQGKPGRSGRKSVAFHDDCSSSFHETVLPKVIAYLQTRSVDAPRWAWCAEYVSRYAEEPEGEQEDLRQLSDEELRQRIQMLARKLSPVYEAEAQERGFNIGASSHAG